MKSREIFFLFSGSALVPRGFAARSPRVLAIYHDSKEKQETARSL